MQISDDDIREFLADSQGLLDLAESELLKIEKGGRLSSSYDAIFRVFHSIKGGAGLLGLIELQQHMHALESTFSNYKAEARPASQMVGFFLRGVDISRKKILDQSAHFDCSVQDQKTESSPSGKPVACASPPSNHSPIASSAEARQTKLPAIPLVYILDDEPDLLETIHDVLVSSNLECRSFLDPFELIKECRAKSPTVILTDFKMPMLSGLEVFNKIREFNQDVPVILVSGYLANDVLINAPSLGVFSAVEKPFSSQTLIATTLSAVRQYHLSKMVRQSMNLLLYQFSDLEDFLKKSQKEDIAHSLRFEITNLIDIWNELNKTK